MQNQLTIRFNEQDGKTVSKFAVSRTGLIWLRNDATKKVTVTFDRKSPLCHGKTSYTTVELDPGEIKVFQICSNVAVTGVEEFKYTAKVEDALEEDPIVIVEPA